MLYNTVYDNTVVLHRSFDASPPVVPRQREVDGDASLLLFWVYRMPICYPHRPGVASTFSVCYRLLGHPSI